MKLFRVKTLGLFGIGFLAGSRAGRGPWDKAQEAMGQMKDKVSGSMGGGTNGSTTSKGFDGQWTKSDPQMTEI